METIITVPGIWKDRSELLANILRATDGRFVYAGLVMIDTKLDAHCELLVEEHDADMSQAFQYAGKVNQLSPEFCEEIETHSNVVVLKMETGSPEAVHKLAEAVQAILMAGGLGVKIENTGIAFSAAQWRDLLEDFEKSNLYQMFVLDSLQHQDGTVASCGMHNLGFPDTIVTGVEFQEAVKVIRVFGYYQLMENPEIEAGNTFSCEPNAPVYQIQNVETYIYDDEDLFGNPYGVWRLVLAED